MKAHPASIQQERAAVLRAAELAQINESLQRREALLAASAKASRLLLEAPDVMGAMPDVLRVLGEAAGVDRTALALAEVSPSGERWLVIRSEWVAEGIMDTSCGPGTKRMVWNERKSDCFCAELQSGRSVYFCKDGSDGVGTSIASDYAKSTVIVPIFVEGEYIGAVGFDSCRHSRQFDPAVISALEIAAGVIGGALHRERLIDTMRLERERAAEQRVAELAKANAVIRGNLERLSSEPDLYSFMGHMLLEMTRQVDAAAGSVAVRKDSYKEWRVIAHVRDGQIERSPFPDRVPLSQAAGIEQLVSEKHPRYVDLRRDPELPWPGMLDFHRLEGHVSLLVFPLMFGQRNVGFLVLGFRRQEPLSLEQSELLVALAQQATLAIELTRLAYSAKEAAVLMERNRIGQEIHDGLAQAFTGILMQLGAAEEMGAFSQDSPLGVILNRIRDLARDGLAEARRSVMALRPDPTRVGGLELALRQLAERSTIGGRITCTFEGGGEATGLAPEHEHALLRIAQEAVSNAVRHARPRTIRLSLTEEPEHWVLSVADDGCGMEQTPEQSARRGFGLTSMRERAIAIGGEWHITSRRGEGTRISVRVPKRKAS